MPKTIARSFRVTFPAIASVVRTRCGIKDPFSRKKKQLQSVVWDTGASHTAINDKLMKRIGFKPTGQIQIKTANGSMVVSTFMVDLILPNQLVIKCLNIAAANLGPETDMLIGMDVISQGNLILENRKGKTRFSFGLPSSWKPKKKCRPISRLAG